MVQGELSVSGVQYLKKNRLPEKFRLILFKMAILNLLYLVIYWNQTDELMASLRKQQSWLHSQTNNMGTQFYKPFYHSQV